jgi:DNA-binding transcriptional LysR family regulator
MDRFHELRVFIAVAESGGFAKAASALHSSGPAVTRAIAALEDRMGVRLFNRTTRRVTLTEPGARFLEDAKRLLADLETAEQSLRGEARQPAGELSITASFVFGREVLPPIVADFVDAHPLVTVSMLLLDRIVDLVDEGIDVAVRIAHMPDSSLMSSQVGAVRRVLVASPAYLAQRGTPRTLQELRGHTIIAHSTLTAGREWASVEGRKSARVKLKPRIETNDAWIGIALAEQGRGVTAALSYMVSGAIRSGRLVSVLDSHSPAAVPVHLVYAQRRIVAPKVRAFIDFATPRLKAALADDEHRKSVVVR